LDAVHVKTHLQDDHYILAACRVDGTDYVFLYDADQRCSFLGRDEQAVDLAIFWERHLEDETYCTFVPAPFSSEKPGPLDLSRGAGLEALPAVVGPPPPPAIGAFPR